MSKSSDKQKASKTIQHKAADYDSVFSGVVEMLDAARRASARVVNTLMTATYWEIGRRIVEHEQAGEKRAEYGEELVRRLAADLTKQFGRGFGFSQLKMMRQFYQTFPNVHTAKPLILQSTVEKSEIGQSVIGQSGNLESSLVPIGQSLIGQFSQRSSVKLSRAIEHLGNIARSLPQKRRASVCGSAAALRSDSVPAVSPSALLFFRSPTADRSQFKINSSTIR